MVVPTGKVLLLGGTLTTLAEPQLSVAPTTKVTLLLLHWPASALTCTFVGQTIIGGVDSVLTSATLCHLPAATMITFDNPPGTLAWPG